MNMFMIGTRANRALAISAGLLLAAGVGALYAPFSVEAFCFGASPSLTFQMLLLTMPLAIIAGAVGSAIGLHTAADGRPYPAWRAAWRAVGLWVGIGLVFTLSILVSVLLIPLCAGAGGLSGLATAFIRTKGRHGQT